MKHVLSLLVVMALVGGCSRAVPLVNPRAIQAGYTIGMTETAIGYALNKRKWMVQSQKPGEIVVLLSVRRHRLWAVVTYNQSLVQVNLLKTERLRQTTRGNVILVHKSVNKWLRNLERDIAVQLTRLSKQGSLLPDTTAAAPPGSR